MNHFERKEREGNCYDLPCPACESRADNGSNGLHQGLCHGGPLIEKFGRLVLDLTESLEFQSVLKLWLMRPGS
jgi:hypothetical protein